MEAIKFLKYILSRIGIMIVLTLFSAFAAVSYTHLTLPTNSRV